MKIIFQLFTQLHFFLYRLTGGRIGGGRGEMSLLLLTTVGRKSGQTRTMPLGAFRDGPNYIIIASNGGQATHPGWYHNLSSNPHVEIQVNDQKLKVVAEVAGSEKRRELWARLLQLAPNYAGYSKSTTREIPVVILKPA